MNSQPEEPSLLRRLFQRLEIDQAVFFAILHRGWQFVAGPLTFLLIAEFFSKAQQGFYVTFWMIINLQTFFELAMPQTVIVTASHLWEKLSLDPAHGVCGDKDAHAKLCDLIRGSMKLYLSIATGFGLIVGTFGMYFFARDPDATTLTWLWPWLILMLTSSILFALTPLLASLEGCGQVGQVYRLQASRAILGNLVVWIAIPLGAGLWTPALASIVRLICELVFLFGVYRKFFASLIKPPVDTKLDWRAEVWPFQWRAIVKGFFSYFNADLMGPVVFHFHGAVVAGAFGMTWNILNSLRVACSSWVRTRLPQLGVLVARRDFKELDRVFLRTSIIATCAMTLALLAFSAGVVTLDLLDLRYADRLLSITPTIFLSLGLLGALIVEFTWTYIHAHRSSPYLVLSVLGAITCGLLIVVLGMHYAETGVAIAFFIINGLVYCPLSIVAWSHCRRVWHDPNNRSETFHKASDPPHGKA